MRCFSASFTQVIVRFYLMMAVVIGSLFAGYPVLALLALPLFLSAILGVRFTAAAAPAGEGSIVELPRTTTEVRTAA